MKTAHIYPGLRYKSSVMRKEIMADPKVLQKLELASNLLRADVPALFKTKRSYQSTQECYGATLAACVSVGSHYVEQHGEPDLVVGYSFGNFSGLVMSKSLDFKKALEFVISYGGGIDNAYSNYSSFLIRGIPHDAIHQFISGLNYAATFINYRDGLTVTLENRAAEKVVDFMADNGGEMESIPLRIQYHTVAFRQIESMMADPIATLSLATPRIRFLSSHFGNFVESLDSIREMLGHMFSGPNNLIPTYRVLQREGALRRVRMNAGGDKANRRKPLDSPSTRPPSAASLGVARGKRESE